MRQSLVTTPPRKPDAPYRGQLLLTSRKTLDRAVHTTMATVTDVVTISNTTSSGKGDIAAGPLSGCDHRCQEHSSPAAPNAPIDSCAAAHPIPLVCFTPQPIVPFHCQCSGWLWCGNLAKIDNGEGKIYLAACFRWVWLPTGCGCPGYPVSGSALASSTDELNEFYSAI